MAAKQVATSNASSGGKQPPAAPPTAKKPGIVESVTTFYEEVMTEMRKVSWPTQLELKSLTQLVLWSLLVAGVVIGLYDIIFLNLMRLILMLG